ncbi:MAG: flagellar basal body rod protein FlgB [Nannocystaceae bacterium]
MADYQQVRIGSAPLAGLDRLSNHLTYHSRRQQLIAANLANLDTPGYRSRDLVFHEEYSAQVQGHRIVRQMDHREEMTISDDETPDQDGNSVSLEQQVARITANSLRYETINQILSRKFAMLRYAANDGR